jgi:multicomponent Na+:H+ antiporter subunit B
VISILLRAAAPWILGIQLVLSLFLLIRGHNLPGGGFIGGLLAASGFILYAMAFDRRSAQRLLRIQPEKLMVTGLLVAVASGWISLFDEESFMKGIWFGAMDFPGLGKIALGTPFIFDIGVYLVVAGMTLMVVFALTEEVKAPGIRSDG